MLFCHLQLNLIYFSLLLFLPFVSTAVSLCSPSPCSLSLLHLYSSVAPRFCPQIYVTAIFIHSQFDLLRILTPAPRFILLQPWDYQVLLLPDSQNQALTSPMRQPYHLGSKHFFVTQFATWSHIGAIGNDQCSMCVSPAEWRLDQWEWTLALTPHRHYQWGISPGHIAPEEFIHHPCIHLLNTYMSHVQGASTESAMTIPRRSLYLSLLFTTSLKMTNP